MARKLRLPETLAFVAIVAAAACGGDDARAPDAAIADAAGSDGPQPCLFYCIPDQYFDDGGLVPDDAGVMCPSCADPVTQQCPSGCRPVG